MFISIYKKGEKQAIEWRHRTPNEGFNKPISLVYNAILNMDAKYSLS